MHQYKLFVVCVCFPSLHEIIFQYNTNICNIVVSAAIRIHSSSFTTLFPAQTGSALLQPLPVSTIVPFYCLSKPFLLDLSLYSPSIFFSACLDFIFLRYTFSNEQFGFTPAISIHYNALKTLVFKLCWYVYL